MGDKAQNQLDAHGCPACPHPTIGPAIAGSPNVLTNSRPAIRIQDPGIHAACCGTNTWKALRGSATVFINNKAAVRKGDATQHCGGIGKMPGTTSSPQNALSTQPASNLHAQKAPEPDKFTLWIKPDAIRGGAMVGETVQILDPATKQVIAETEVDKDGNVLASVPENKPYDLNIVGDRDVIPGEGIENEDIVSSTLHVALFDYAGQSVEEGLKVTVSGNGTTHEFHTTADGSISPQLPDGVYDVEINGQKFSAHTLRWIDLAHEGGSPFQFQLVPDDSELDYNAIEQARQNRTRPSESDEG